MYPSFNLKPTPIRIVVMWTWKLTLMTDCDWCLLSFLILIGCLRSWGETLSCSQLAKPRQSPHFHLWTFQTDEGRDPHRGQPYCGPRWVRPLDYLQYCRLVWYLFCNLYTIHDPYLCICLSVYLPTQAFLSNLWTSCLTSLSGCWFSILSLFCFVILCIIGLGSSFIPWV